MFIEYSLMSNVAFLTNISFVLVLLAPFIYQYIDLLFLTFFVCIGGLYISYVNPGVIRYSFNEHDYEIKGVFKVFLDIFLHVLPFLYILTRYGEFYKSNPNIIPPIILVLVYISCIDIKYVYQTNTDAIGLIFILCIIFYAFYTRKK